MTKHTPSSQGSNLTTIAIRVDSSSRMGTGHVMRCLTLAKKMKALSIRTLFLSRNHQGNINHLIEQSGFELVLLAKPTINIEHQTNDKFWLGCSAIDDAKECKKQLNGISIDLLIVDHYSLDIQWQQLIKKYLQPRKIMVIDDLANRAHECDILLDQTLGRKYCDYKDLVPKDCQLLLGADFIMLRDEFLLNRPLAQTKRKQTSVVNHILISMGGTDPDNIAETLLIWLIQFQQTNQGINVTLVANPSSIFLNNLKAVSANHNWITVVTQPESMAKLMLMADIAIGSSGATAWERCCLGLPSLSIVSAVNQDFLNESLSQAGAIKNLGHHVKLTYKDFETSLNQLMHNRSNYLKMVNCSFNCCDGLGVNKVVDIIANNKSMSVRLQKAVLDDCFDIFQWQSNTEIRKYFHNPEPVKWQQHCDWLKATLKNENKHLYMIKLVQPNNQKRQSIGLVRLDILTKFKVKVDARWLVSIIISPKQQGKNFAQKALELIPTIFKEQGIIAEVHLKNAASHKLFSRAGFTQISPISYYLKANSQQGEANV